LLESGVPQPARETSIASARSESAAGEGVHYGFLHDLILSLERAIFFSTARCLRC
jgi:hypothetical protein